MPDFSPAEIFNPGFDFRKQALQLFKIQSEHNRVYSEYLKLIGVNPREICSAEQIPFLPVELFKFHEVVTDYDFGFSGSKIKFISSGTTGNTSHHLIHPEWYKRVCLKNFEWFYGKVQDYVILALLPSYLEQKHSSLVFMMNHLMQSGGSKESGFYLHHHDDLLLQLKKLKSSSQKIWLIGVTYALLDLADTMAAQGMHSFFSGFENLILMETGGMKGRRKELLREEVHALLKTKTGISAIHSEYGMTELMSQAYSKSEGLFYTPPWMHFHLRPVHDPLSREASEKTGAVNIIDLANIFSCAFIATHDLGRSHPCGGFEILGRMDHSDWRGCNLMVN
jgi:phenylacetate-coenzyme A ligase PaaK-like adenylate-forming protein